MVARRSTMVMEVATIVIVMDDNKERSQTRRNCNILRHNLGRIWSRLGPYISREKHKQ